MKRTPSRESKSAKLREARSVKAHTGGKFCALGPLLCGECAKNEVRRRGDALVRESALGVGVAALLGGMIGGGLSVTRAGVGRTDEPPSNATFEFKLVSPLYGQGGVRLFTLTAKELSRVLDLKPGGDWIPVGSLRARRLP